MPVRLTTVIQYVHRVGSARSTATVQSTCGAPVCGLVGIKRVEHLRQDPRVSLTVMDADNWYRHVSIIGRVAEMADDPDLSGIDRLSTQYLGNAYGQRDRPRVNAWIEIERWHTWEGGRPMGVELASG